MISRTKNASARKNTGQMVLHQPTSAGASISCTHRHSDQQQGQEGEVAEAHQEPAAHRGPVEAPEYEEERGDVHHVPEEPAVGVAGLELLQVQEPEHEGDQDQVAQQPLAEPFGPGLRRPAPGGLVEKQDDGHRDGGRIEHLLHQVGAGPARSSQTHPSRRKPTATSSRPTSREPAGSRTVPAVNGLRSSPRGGRRRRIRRQASQQKRHEEQQSECGNRKHHAQEQVRARLRTPALARRAAGGDLDRGGDGENHEHQPRARSASRISYQRGPLRAAASPGEGRRARPRRTAATTTSTAATTASTTSATIPNVLNAVLLGIPPVPGCERSPRRRRQLRFATS